MSEDDIPDLATPQADKVAPEAVVLRDVTGAPAGLVTLRDLLRA